MTTTVRTNPSGNKMVDGYSTKIAFSLNPGVLVWEKQVTPPGKDAGQPIDITDMYNEKWRTMAGRSLKTLTAPGAQVSWDPDTWAEMDDMIGKNQWMTVILPNGSTIDFCAILQSFVPGAHTEGAQPEATMNIVPTNVDPDSLTFEEIDPVYTAAT